MGARVAALRAGYRPDSRPITVAKSKVVSGSQSGVMTADIGGGAPVWADWPAM